MSAMGEDARSAAAPGTEPPAPSRRLPAGGRVDRGTPIRFTFDGVGLTGLRGDTLASALLANGVDVVARGIYTGRPRGILASGADEPNAFVQVDGEPMVGATQLELREGLAVRSLAGFGRLEAGAMTNRYDKRFVHTDVLVVGAGPAGLTAALEAGRAGVRVLLVDEQSEPGGTLLDAPATIDGRSGSEWLAAATSELGRLPDTRVLVRATTLGLYDHGYAVIAERRPGRTTAGRLWHVRAKRVVLATGAHQRPIVFADNDRPGIMLASAAVAYAHRYGVRPGERAVVFTADASGEGAAVALRVLGVEVVDVVDAREGRAVVGTRGDGRLQAVIVDSIDPDGHPIGAAREVPCDLLAVAGGWTPVTGLWTHTRGTLRYREDIAAFVPDRPNGPHVAAGAVNGTFDLAGCLAEGLLAGAVAAAGVGVARAAVVPPPADGGPSGDLQPVWAIAAPDGGWDRHFVDLQRDATVADIVAATSAGLRSVEHVKRFTTIGTAVDQGRTSGLIASAVAAELMNQPLSEAGLTTARPPSSPASFTLLAGRDRGALHDPARSTSIHAWHVAHGAVFEDVGQWKRARYYPRDDESMDEAVLRECAATRSSVGVLDASTLGKIDLQGPDTGVFLDRIYTNRFSNLKVGSCRYGVMCRADGMVFDDGVTTRLADDRFHMTTTTGNAAAVLDWLEEWLQTEWPDLRVRCTSVTEQWATVAVVGPRSRDVLATLAPDLDVSREGFPFMTWRQAVVAGTDARVFRISFSGELAYEINVPTWYGRSLWEAVIEAGRPFDITPYGTETMHVLRAEKGYPIIGQETDGSITPQDLGMDWIVSKQKPFVGSRSHRRLDTSRPDRKHLVGLLPLDPDDLLPEGAQLVADPAHPLPNPMLGHVTSSYRSAALGRTFALALVRGGRERMDEVVHAPLGDRTVAARIVPPVLFDPDNARRDGEPVREDEPEAVA